MFTIGNYVFLGFLAIVLIAISISIGVCTDSVAFGIGSGIISIAIVIAAFAVSTGIIHLPHLVSAPIKIINLIQIMALSEKLLLPQKMGEKFFTIKEKLMLNPTTKIIILNLNLKKVSGI